MYELCSPALIYVAFSLTQVLLDVYQGLYNTAIMKSIIAVIITLLLNTLCSRGMGIVSWIIVFIPFILMTVIVTILLYIFGLDPASGKLNVICKNKKDGASGNLIFVSTPKKQNVKYVDVTYGETPLEHENVPFWTSDYQM